MDLVINMLDFAADNESQVNEVSQMCSPEIVFTVLNNSLSDNQKTTFEYCYSNKFEISGDDMFRTWKALKDSLQETSIPCTPCSESLCSVVSFTEVNRGQYTQQNDPLRVHVPNVNITREPSAPLVEIHQTTAAEEPKVAIQTENSDNLTADARPIHLTFPFLNTSFPGDEDNDILPYPETSFKKKNGNNVKENILF